VARPLIAALAAAVLLAGCGGSAAREPSVYVLHDDVVVDLAGGGYATVTVGLQVQSGTDTAESQTGVVREIVTNDLTGIDRADLLDHERRDFLKLKLARDIRSHTDIELDAVLLTDLTMH
jgi:hypothetical protein